MLRIKEFELTDNQYNEALDNDFVQKRKKSWKKMDEIADKYKLDTDLFRYNCLNSIDNLANAFLDEGNSSVEGAFKRSFSEFNSDGEKWILENYVDILVYELRHLMQSKETKEYIKNMVKQSLL